LKLTTKPVGIVFISKKQREDRRQEERYRAERMNETNIKGRKK
jgi:hypothetical protein